MARSGDERKSKAHVARMDVVLYEDILLHSTGV